MSFIKKNYSLFCLNDLVFGKHHKENRCITSKKSALKYVTFLTFFFMGAFIISYSQTGVFYAEDFETGSLPSNTNVQCYNQSQRLTIQSAITRNGNYAAQFEKLPNEGKRCEIVPTSTAQQYLWGEEYWMGFSFNLPYFLDNSLGWRVLNQHHAVPGPIGNPDWSVGAGSNGFTIAITDGEFNIRMIPSGEQSLNTYIDGTLENPIGGGASYATNSYHSWPVETNRWFDIVANFKYSDQSDGFFKVWLNGVLVADITGSNVHLHDRAGRLKERRNYQKMGIYTGTPGGGAIIYDEFRIGDATSSYQDVAPQGTVLEISDEVFKNTISIIPNPVDNIFTINLKDDILEKVTIYNQLGQQVKKIATDKVDISNLSKGIYFVKITSQIGKTATKKIIKN